MRYLRCLTKPSYAISDADTSVVMKNFAVHGILSHAELFVLHILHSKTARAPQGQKQSSFS